MSRPTVRVYDLATYLTRRYGVETAEIFLCRE
jgi:hypothetical protein